MFNDALLMFTAAFTDAGSMLRLDDGEEICPEEARALARYGIKSLQARSKVLIKALLLLDCCVTAAGFTGLIKNQVVRLHTRLPGIACRNPAPVRGCSCTPPGYIGV